MKSKKKKLVIFDFDGVLVNTLNFSFDIHKSFNKDLTWDQFQDFSNGNFYDGVDKKLKGGKYIAPDNFKFLYDKNIKELNINDILKETVIKLSLKYNLVIVSSAESDSISKFLKKKNILDLFNEILGADFHKSKVFKINHLLDKNNINLEDTIFITDSLGDIIEGNECGVGSIGVTWGIHNRETLEKGKPIIILEDPNHLYQTIENILE